MKLLLDQNLSPRLVARLADLFPGSVHVAAAGLDSAPDRAVWFHARDHGLVLVTRDSDFRDMSTLLGWPPKVIWLRTGNTATAQDERVLRAHHQALEAWSSDPNSGIYAIH